jgi:uncharacterized protein YacL
MTSPVVSPSKTDKLVAAVKGEIAVVIGAVLAAVNALQLLAVPLPTWTHTVIVVTTTVAAALGIRARVTPVLP